MATFEFGQVPSGLTPIASVSEKLTVSTAVKTLTAANYGDTSGKKSPACAAIISVDSQPIRFTLDGTTPDSNTGHGADANDIIVLSSIAQIEKLKMIREGGSDAVVQVTYLR